MQGTGDFLCIRLQLRFLIRIKIPFCRVEIQCEKKFKPSYLSLGIHYLGHYCSSLPCLLGPSR